MRSEIQMTDDQINQILDEIGCGAVVVNLKFTRETIADWIESSKGWAERRGYEEDEASGLKFVRFDNAQVVKGQPRGDIYVIDFGPARGVVH